jgi:hypothetical protein
MRALLATAALAIATSAACQSQPKTFWGVPACSAAPDTPDSTKCCRSVTSCGGGVPCNFSIEIFVLAKRVDKDALPALLRALATGRFGAMYSAATALGNIGDAASIAPLANALDVRQYRVQVSLLNALAKFGSLATEATPKIEPLTRHWSPEVRAAARAALRSITGVDLPASVPDTIATIRQIPSGWEVQRRGRSIRLADVSITLAADAPAACTDRESEVRSTDVMYLGTTCLVTCAEGEFGGAVLQSGPGTRPLCRFVVGANMRRFFTAHGAYFALGSWGPILSLTRGEDGAWASQELTTLPSQPLGLGHDVNGDAVFFAYEEMDPNLTPRLIEQWEYVLRLSPNGDLTSWP